MPSPMYGRHSDFWQSHIWLWLRFLVLGLLALVVVGIGVAIYWTYMPYRADAAHVAKVRANTDLQVTEYGQYWQMVPRQGVSDVGLIFYPGGVVESQAYLYRLSELAESGVSVFIVNPPLHLANLAATEPDQIRQLNPQIKTWYVGGHSIGGIMACWYVDHHPDIGGLVLMAAYCLDDIHQRAVPVLDISGQDDTLVTAVTLARYQHNLPSSAKLVVLPGFNHSAFGDYGQLQLPEGTQVNGQQVQEELTDLLESFVLPEAGH